MTAEVSELPKKALTLSSEERAALAGSLLESLDDPASDQRVEEAWDLEIQRRVEEIRFGKVQTIPIDHLA